MPLGKLRAEPRWRERPGRLGVRIQPADRIEELLEEFPRLELIAVEFPSPGDGRGCASVTASAASCARSARA